MVSNDNYATNQADFMAAINGLTATGVSSANFGDVVTELASAAPFMAGANRYVFTYTAESINGNGITTSDAQVSQYVNLLKENNLKVSVITAPSEFEDGDPRNRVGTPSPMQPEEVCMI